MTGLFGADDFRIHHTKLRAVTDPARIIQDADWKSLGHPLIDRLAHSAYSVRNVGN